MQFDRSKLNTLILYTCSKCEPSQLGAVKLHKVLYYSDMLCYAEHGHSITGSTYRKRPFGPTCDQLLSSVRELTSNHALDVKQVEYFGYWKKEYIALSEPEAGRLSQDDIEIIDSVIEFVCRDNSARTISEISHNRAWELADFGEILPYNSVFQIFPTEASLETLAWAEGEASKIEDQRSKSDPLGYVTFANFRSRVLQARGS